MDSRLEPAGMTVYRATLQQPWISTKWVLTPGGFQVIIELFNEQTLICPEMFIPYA